MAYSKLLVHCVFSTSGRRKSIPAELQPDLWAYMGGIARKHGCKALAVGGTADHAHLLLSLRADLSVAKVMQLIKAGSSKWMHDQKRALFSWQEAYGAFTIGASQVARTVTYILGQPAHHKRVAFEDEFKSLLARYQVEYDPKFLFA